MSESWRNSVVAIFAPFEGEAQNKEGTGILVSEDLVLTARHVVFSSAERRGPVRLRWQHTDDPDFGPHTGEKANGYHLALEVDGDAGIAWDCVDLDLALLRCRKPSDLHPVQPVNQKPTDRDPFALDAFPKIGPDHWQESEYLSGTCSSLKGRGDKCRFELLSMKHARTDEVAEIASWSGASGAAVLRTKGGTAKIIGVLTKENLIYQSAFEAVPIFLAFRKDGFREHLFRGERGEKLRNLMRAKLDTLPQRVRDHLASSLGTGAEISPEDLEADHRETLKALNKLHRQAGAEESAVIMELAAAVAVCHHGERLPSVSAESATLAQHFLEASSPFGTEIALAALDQRLPEHRPKQSEGDLPRGRLCLDVPPEEGRGAPLDLDAKDLEKVTGADIAEALERGDPKAQRPKQWLRNREELGDPRYYLAVPAKGESGQKACEKLAESLVEEWPFVRVAGYDPDLPDGDDDESRYGFFRNVLPDAPDPHSSGG